MAFRQPASWCRACSGYLKNTRENAFLKALRTPSTSLSARHHGRIAAVFELDQVVAVPTRPSRCGRFLAIIGPRPRPAARRSLFRLFETHRVPEPNF